MSSHPEQLNPSQIKNPGLTEMFTRRWQHGAPLLPPRTHRTTNMHITNSGRRSKQPNVSTGTGWSNSLTTLGVLTVPSHIGLSEHCDTSDLQSEAETQTSHKRKHKPNPLYTYSDSEDEQPTKKRFPQAPRVKIPALITPQSSPQPTDSRHHNVPPSFRHLSPLRQNTPNDTALQSPQRAESDVEAFPIDDSRDSVRPLLQDATSQKILTMLSDLTRSLNELHEVRAIRNTGCNESVDAGVLPLDLPLHNIEELNNAEAALQSQEANKAMVRRFALIGGTTLEVRVCRVMAYAITNELASVLNWAGKKTKDQTKQKRAFKDTALCRCIFDGLTQQLGANSMSEFVFAQAVQKWLRYAPDRLGGAGRTSSVPIPE
ncbi:hypothetical protein ACER0C_001882 [Sarotherodon galilaeus]